MIAKDLIPGVGTNSFVIMKCLFLASLLEITSASTGPSARIPVAFYDRSQALLKQ
jgi:hypothetical protein